MAEARAIVEGCRRFDKLDQLAEAAVGRLTGKRISELLATRKVPDRDRLKAVIEACHPRAWPDIELLLRNAQAEEVARSAHPQPRWADYAMVLTDTHRLPLVSEITDWTMLGVHRPIARPDGRADADVPGLPAYVLRERDRTVLRPRWPDSSVVTSPARRWVSCW
ncbi:MAG: hypothetical protein BGP03_12780 [Pseudonocardia sp. 73-21]|nr:MAG: hypothetical protein BGP03_12780 [Pseudonocardia sp. 73-21]